MNCPSFLWVWDTVLIFFIFSSLVLLLTDVLPLEAASFADNLPDLGMSRDASRYTVLSVFVIEVGDDRHYF